MGLRDALDAMKTKIPLYAGNLAYSLVTILNENTRNKHPWFSSYSSSFLVPYYTTILT
jgi:hypothetical protein